MRFKSEKVQGYQVFAVTGTNTVSFGIDFKDADTKGLLGFAVERFDKEEDERYFLFGFKVFEEVIPHPDEKTQVKTDAHPVQSFVHDDFTGKPDHTYEYSFYPLKGKPKKLERLDPITIKVRTEPLFSRLEHDVFFNRGVASSQAYVRKFNNVTPSKLPKAKQEEALEWLSRKLDDALLKFIGQAKKGDTLLCCFYEFRYKPAAEALKAALDRKVNVRIIIDSKKNETVDKKTGEVKKAFPRTENLKIVKDFGFPKEAIIRREAQPGQIQHNKLMVLLRGAGAKPQEVWTGSTNLSDGGIHGQTNVGHWVRDADTAAKFRDYWEILAKDPGSKGKDDPDGRAKTAKLRAAVEEVSPTIESIDDIPEGITPIFSPRSGLAMLDRYAELLDSAERLGCITLAFGISGVFKERLSDNDANKQISFFLLEKEDKPNPESKKPFVKLDARNNVYKAWGSFLKDPIAKWTRETNAGRMGLNQHVSYIHSKFLLKDPLGEDPIVITGSANFSDASTNANDENMLIIRGDQRVADIYFTEFNRLFFHYYFRSVRETMAALEEKKPEADTGFSGFLEPNDSWLDKYKPGSLRTKRVEVFTRMTGFAPKP